MPERHDLPVHRERADRGDRALSRAATSTSAATRCRRRAGRRARVAQEVIAREARRTSTSCRAGSSGASSSSSSRTDKRLIGWDEILEGGLAPEADGDVVARNDGRHRRGARGPRRDHDAELATCTSTTTRATRASSRWPLAAESPGDGLRVRTGPRFAHTGDTLTPERSAEPEFGAQPDLRWRRGRDIAPELAPGTGTLCL